MIPVYLMVGLGAASQFVFSLKTAVLAFFPLYASCALIG